MPPSEAPVNQSAGASTVQSDSVRSARWLTLFLLFAACTALRLVCLTAKPFWFDECFSVQLARIDWRNFLHLLWWREANMSLYYVMLRAWLRFGQSEFLVRGLSVAIAVATLPAIYWLARALYDRKVALIAAALYTFNAYSVRYAQEARSYALFLLLATLSSAFLVSWMRQPSRRSWLGYVVASILAVYAHLYTLLLVVAHWIILRWVVLKTPDADASQGRTVIHAPMQRAWKIIGIAALPLLIFVAKTGAGPIRWIQRPGLHDVLEFFEHLAGSDSSPLLATLAMACLGAVAPLGKRLWTRDQSWESWRMQFLLIWLAFPVALTILLSFARPVFLARYMIFCLPPLLILAAAGLARLRQSWMLAAALTLILFLCLRGVFFVYGHDFDNERDASGAASSFILDHTQSGDGVVFHIAETRVPYEFFRSERSGRDSASPAFTAHFGPEILFPYHGPGLDYRDFTGKPTADFLRTTAPSHPRVWVMLMDNGPPGNPDPTTMMLTETLPLSFPKIQRWQFPRVEVRLYSK
jgi:mannosyltransferase